MATPLEIVASHTQDAYLQTYRTTTDFFDIDDYIFHCAAAAATFYQQLYDKEYARMRADGQKDQVVAFANDFLSTQILKVEKKDGETFAMLTDQVFSFAYDQSNTGLQNVFCFVPRPVYELERSDIDELWQLQYLPKTNKIFWALDGDRILLVNKGGCNVKEIKVLYVPQVNADNPKTLLPDSIVKPVIDATVLSMKEYADKNVIKKTLDNQQNKTLQTEANLSAAK